MVATIQFHRPDLPLHHITGAGKKNKDDKITPLNPPYNFYPGIISFHLYFFLYVNGIIVEGVPGIGELMLASFPPKKFFLNFDAKSWYPHTLLTISQHLIPYVRWIGEKYDGIRVCWVKTRKELYHYYFFLYGFHLINEFRFSRTGVSLEFSPSFCTLFPNSDLEGESWFGRGSFPEAQHLFKDSPNTMLFLRCILYFLLYKRSFIVRIVAFDQPDTPQQFEYRYQKILHVINADHPFIESILCILLKSI